MSKLQILVGSLLLMMTTGGARAASAPSPTDVWDRRLGINLHLSMGGPFGWLGGSLEVAPTRWLVLEGGGGRGISGVQWAFEPRLRLPFPFRKWGFGLALGGGLSGGAYDDGWRDWLFSNGLEWDMAIWANVTASMEFRFSSGFQMRIYAGKGILLNTDSYRCDLGRTGCGDPRQPTVPYVGVTAGWSF